MCGIVGFVSTQKRPELIENLTFELSHRGPDKQNFEIINVDNKYLHLGSSRLSIRDLDDGNMPMKNSNENQIIYNGEIFDFSKLKKLYKLTNLKSDTRLILEILSSSDSIPMFNGMYAYAFYNNKEKKLILSRDKFGIKPLYYAQVEKFPLIFSSELCTFQNEEFKLETIAEKEIKNYIYFGGFTNDSNPILGVNKIQPGSSFTFDITSLTTRFDKCKTIDSQIDSENLNFKDTFINVVSDHLDADTDVDILLSGGVDSSLLALVTKYELGKNVRTFSLGFDNEKFDESSKSLYISNKLNFHHEHIIFKQKDINEIIKEFLDLTSEPIGDPSIIPSYFLYKNVSQHTKAVLSGDGADEMFLGYDWHRAAIIQENRMLNRIFGNHVIKNLVKSITKNSDRLYRYNKFFETIDKDIYTQILFWQNINIDEQSQQLVYEEFIEQLNFHKNDFYTNLKKLDLNFYLSTNILPKADIGSMLNGLEIRPPYLDDRIFHYSFNNEVKKNFIRYFTHSKSELRDMLAVYTNKRFSQQSKRGFSPDFENWDKSSAAELLKKYSNDIEIVSKFLHMYENLDESYFKTRELWKFYSLFKWIDNKKLDIIIEN
tara:strand:+ start:338 stop:2140 length:1803 start_codon:yes stop_codon:yes gene_type:complete